MPEDSLPWISDQVEVQIITQQPRIPQEEIERVKAELRDYTDRVNNGESSFSTLAILYSEDPGSAAMEEKWIMWGVENWIRLLPMSLSV